MPEKKLKRNFDFFHFLHSFTHSLTHFFRFFRQSTTAISQHKRRVGTCTTSPVSLDKPISPYWECAREKVKFHFSFYLDIETILSEFSVQLGVWSLQRPVGGSSGLSVCLSVCVCVCLSVRWTVGHIADLSFAPLLCRIDQRSRGGWVKKVSFFRSRLCFGWEWICSSFE